MGINQIIQHRTAAWLNGNEIHRQMRRWPSHPTVPIAKGPAHNGLASLCIDNEPNIEIPEECIGPTATPTTIIDKYKFFSALNSDVDILLVPVRFLMLYLCD